MYSIWLLEYAHMLKHPVGNVLAGQHNAGFRELTFSYVLIKGDEHIIMVDVGSNGNDPITQQLHERDNISNWHSPEDVLEKVDLTPEDVDTVVLTHAHFDHIDNMLAFKNAVFYLQEKELMGSIWAMTRPKKFRRPNMALKSQNIYTALHLIEEERMKLISGVRINILPDIDIYPAYNSHTFASQIVLVHNGEENWACIGDIAYVRQNFTGLNDDGVYVPIGSGVGSPYTITKKYDEILNMVNGDVNHIIIGHETDNWRIYPSKKGEDGLWLSEISLSPRDKSKIGSGIQN